MATDVLAGDLDYRPEFERWDRGYLPHIEAPGHAQLVTFRLADALPKRVVEEIKRRSAAGEFRSTEAAWAEPWLDAGHGSCVLRSPKNALVVAEALTYGDRVRYDLFAWVVMPNHVHVIFQPYNLTTMSDIIHTWKSYSVHQINRRLGTTGRLWQRGYFDRVIRDEQHLQRAVDYVEYNPVAADLVQDATSWPCSSKTWFYTRPDECSQATTSAIVSSAGRCV